jgi:diadenosine tetraphosphatase ApaH/serine/threonine PP2A family protein phosphatase
LIAALGVSGFSMALDAIRSAPPVDAGGCGGLLLVVHSVKFAIFSDVHGNLEALEAVLADINAERVQEMICLGDIVGYGPNPAECLELIRGVRCSAVLGNHDEACIEPGMEGALNDYARAGIAFARKRLSSAQKDWLRNRPLRLDFDDFTAVHSSLNDDESWQYILSPMDAHEHFLFQEKPLCFCGHTHKPALWTQEGRAVRVVAPAGPGTFPLSLRTLVNVGSVGQPRNLRPEACYAIYNRAALSVGFRFVSYNLQKTQEKIVKAGLPRFLAQRLAVGR